MTAEPMTDASPLPLARFKVLDLTRKAQRHLSRRDSVLKSLIKKVGNCTLQPGGEGFVPRLR